MKPYERIEQLLGEPTYRTKLAFFALLGGLITLLAVVIKHPFWSNVLLEFAVTFGAVALIQFLWDFLGGEPMELQIGEVQNEIVHVRQSVNAEIASLKQSMTLLADLIDGNIGIERIWPDRRTWQSDPADGLSAWQARVCQAANVAIMSMTLWNNWLHQEQFRKQLFANIAGGASVRILVYDPDSEVLHLRAKDERDPPGQMQLEIKSTLLRLAETWDSLGESVKKNLKVRLTAQTLQYTQIIQADDQVLVAIYLSGKSGGPSPTMQLRGPESTWFLKYLEQFEIMWRRGRPLGDDEFRQILRTLEDIPIAPTED
jgi:hypothetical protein